MCCSNRRAYVAPPAPAPTTTTTDGACTGQKGLYLGAASAACHKCQRKGRQCWRCRRTAQRIAEYTTLEHHLAATSCRKCLRKQRYCCHCRDLAIPIAFALALALDESGRNDGINRAADDKPIDASQDDGEHMSDSHQPQRNPAQVVSPPPPPPSYADVMEDTKKVLVN